jgi:hypothetical protein
MTDVYIISDGCAVFLVCAVDTVTILNIHFIPHFDKINIPSHDGIEPETAIITGFHIAYDSGIGGNKSIVSKAGEFSFNGENDGHLFWV